MSIQETIILIEAAEPKAASVGPGGSSAITNRKRNDMLKIGGECRQCLNYDDERGCKIIGSISMTRDDDDVVYCIDGIRKPESDE